ncbi:hypothetical protein CK203_047459 [Vitis vinifera]|uniref:Uncharacterized protein n=1 Tax=Vitis vinifera TaxID=29760 RepID=A0A438H6J6_VITVI|nr:hypothetical protein CK203_047459 [Vitis vinifera]
MCSFLWGLQYAVSAPVVEEEAETVVFPRGALAIDLSQIVSTEICPSYLSSCREGPGFSYGLNWALAGKGVIVNDKAFRNLKSSELQQKGTTIAESLSGLPIHVRGDVLGGASEIPKAQFSKLLKQACCSSWL